MPFSKLCIADVIEWDISNWSRALKYWEENTSVDLSSAKALEIGSRNGGLSLWMALHGSRVLCSDIHGPSERAVPTHQKYNVSRLIDYKSIDALDIPYEEEFDVVLFKSVLGAIGKSNNVYAQFKAVRQIYKCLKKDGELFFAENLVASPIHRFLRARYVRWGTQWRYVTIEEMLQFLSVFTDIRHITVGFLGALGRTERQRKILGVCDRFLLDCLVPARWRYIIAGVARK